MIGGQSINDMISDEEQKRCLDDGSSLASSVQPMRVMNNLMKSNTKRMTQR